MFIRFQRDLIRLEILLHITQYMMEGILKIPTRIISNSQHQPWILWLPPSITLTIKTTLALDIQFEIQHIEEHLFNIQRPLKRILINNFMIKRIHYPPTTSHLSPPVKISHLKRSTFPHINSEWKKKGSIPIIVSRREDDFLQVVRPFDRLFPYIVLPLLNSLEGSV